MCELTMRLIFFFEITSGYWNINPWPGSGLKRIWQTSPHETRTSAKWTLHTKVSLLATHAIKGFLPEYNEDICTWKSGSISISLNIYVELFLHRLPDLRGFLRFSTIIHPGSLRLNLTYCFNLLLVMSKYLRLTFPDLGSVLRCAEESSLWVVGNQNSKEETHVRQVTKYF